MATHIFVYFFNILSWIAPFIYCITKVTYKHNTNVTNQSPQGPLLAQLLAFMFNDLIFLRLSFSCVAKNYHISWLCAFYMIHVEETVTFHSISFCFYYLFKKNHTELLMVGVEFNMLSSFLLSSYLQLCPWKHYEEHRFENLCFKYGVLNCVSILIPCCL